MTQASIQDEAQTLPQAIYLKNYQAPHYFIDEVNLSVDLYDDHALVTSHLQIRRNQVSTDPSKALVLYGEEMTLISVKLNRVTLSPQQYDVTEKLLTIPHMTDQAELEIVTRILPQKNTALSGLYRSANTFCTQCEAEGFRRITYFMDRPDILSRYSTRITADAKAYPILLSNGNLIESGRLENGRHFAVWQDPFNKPCYLFALVAGDFDLLADSFSTQSGREVALRIYVEKGYGNQAHHAMHCVKQAMRWDEEKYGREYDLDIYMIVAISDFNMGAMENKGLNIFNTKYVLAKPETATDEDYIHILSVIGHEYFHNWSGNRVTCRDWFQLSLKEGLTIFRDQSFTEDLLSAAVMRIRDVNYLRESQFPEDAGPLAHPVRPDSYIEINNFYTATVYNKGAEVLRMLQTMLGKALFRKGMDLYFARYDGQAVTIEDYIKTMEEISGLDLSQFRRWYTQSRTPTLTVEDNYDAERNTYTLTFAQACAPTQGEPEKKPFYIPMRMGLLNEKGEDLPLHIQGEPVSTEKVIAVTEAMQMLQFQKVSSRPIPSLLRNFSAPVKLHYRYSDNELAFLCRHDSDAFNRWEAGQKYTLRLLLNLCRDEQQEKNLHLPTELIDMYQHMLKQTKPDKFLLAECLSLPSEKYIGEQMEVVDVDAIHSTREFTLMWLAQSLQAVFLDLYHDNYREPGEYQFNIEEIGRRQLQNACLAYLMQLPAHANLGERQFVSALKSDMTNTQAALVSIANQDLPFREKALADFYSTWKHDALVVDKWLAIQAGTKLPFALKEIRKLMRHEAFDIKNPNKVYALIGTFAYRNSVNFHAINGDGYAFLGEVVQRLDELNPQVAARMVKPLTTWNRYDKERQALMRMQLELLLKKRLSSDLYELVTKSL